MRGGRRETVILASWGFTPVPCEFGMNLEVVVSRVLPKLLGENLFADPTYQQGVEQLQVSPSSKNVSSRMVADNNADTVSNRPAVSKNRLATEEYEGVYCSWDRLIEN